MIDHLKIHALADGELSAAEQATLREQIAACEKSTAELQAIKNVKALMAGAEPVNCEETWKACVKRLNEIDKTKRIENVVGRYAWGLCGIFFIAIAFGGYSSRTNSNGTVRSGDVPGMVSGLTPFSSFKSGGSQHDAEKWLSENLNNVPMPSSNLRMVRALVGNSTDGHRMAKLTLRDEKGELALLVIFGVDRVSGLEGDGSYRHGRIDEMRCVAWSYQNNALLLIGDRSDEDLQDIASTVRIGR